MLRSHRTNKCAEFSPHIMVSIQKLKRQNEKEGIVGYHKDKARRKGQGVSFVWILKADCQNP